VGAHNRRDRAAVKRDLEVVYNYFPRLKDLRRNTAATFPAASSRCWSSGGNDGHPKLMMLDEPSLGLAPLLVEEIYDIISGSTPSKRPPFYSSSKTCGLP